LRASTGQYYEDFLVFATTNCMDIKEVDIKNKPTPTAVATAVETPLNTRANAMPKHKGIAQITKVIITDNGNIISLLDVR